MKKVCLILVLVMISLAVSCDGPLTPGSLPAEEHPTMEAPSPPVETPQLEEPEEDAGETAFRRVASEFYLAEDSEVARFLKGLDPEEYGEQLAALGLAEENFRFDLSGITPLSYLLLASDYESGGFTAQVEQFRPEERMENPYRVLAEDLNGHPLGTLEFFYTVEDNEVNFYPSAYIPHLSATVPSLEAHWDELLFKMETKGYQLETVTASAMDFVHSTAGRLGLGIYLDDGTRQGYCLMQKDELGYAAEIPAEDLFSLATIAQWLDSYMEGPRFAYYIWDEAYEINRRLHWLDVVGQHSGTQPVQDDAMAYQIAASLCQYWDIVCRFHFDRNFTSPTELDAAAVTEVAAAQAHSFRVQPSANTEAPPSDPVLAYFEALAEDGIYPEVIARGEDVRAMAGELFGGYRLTGSDGILFRYAQEADCYYIPGGYGNAAVEIPVVLSYVENDDKLTTTVILASWWMDGHWSLGEWESGTENANQELLAYLLEESAALPQYHFTMRKGTNDSWYIQSLRIDHPEAE